ncbi:MAG TPA: hypothetical protein VF278_18330 [Pirellulales bacterium]
MKPMQVESQIGPDGVLHLAVSVGSSEANRQVIVTIEPLPKPESSPRQDAWSESLYGSCAGLGLEEPPDLSLPPLPVE